MLFNRTSLLLVELKCVYSIVRLMLSMQTGAVDTAADTFKTARQQLAICKREKQTCSPCRERRCRGSWCHHFPRCGSSPRWDGEPSAGIRRAPLARREARPWATLRRAPEPRSAATTNAVAVLEHHLLTIQDFPTDQSNPSSSHSEYHSSIV